MIPLHPVALHSPKLRSTFLSNLALSETCGTLSHCWTGRKSVPCIRQYVTDRNTHRSRLPASDLNAFVALICVTGADLFLICRSPALKAGHDGRLEQTLDDLQLRRQRRRLCCAGRQVQACRALPRAQAALEVVSHQLEQLRRQNVRLYGLAVELRELQRAAVNVQTDDHWYQQQPSN